MKIATNLLSFLQLDLEQLMHRFFVIQRVHDCKVDDTPKIDEVRLCPVLDAFLIRYSCKGCEQ